MTDFNNFDFEEQKKKARQQFQKAKGATTVAPTSLPTTTGTQTTITPTVEPEKTEQDLFSVHQEQSKPLQKRTAGMGAMVGGLTSAVGEQEKQEPFRFAEGPQTTEQEQALQLEMATGRKPSEVPEVSFADVAPTEKQFKDVLGDKFDPNRVPTTEQRKEVAEATRIPRFIESEVDRQDKIARPSDPAANALSFVANLYTGLSGATPGQDSTIGQLHDLGRVRPQVELMKDVERETGKSIGDLAVDVSTRPEETAAFGVGGAVTGALVKNVLAYGAVSSMIGESALTSKAEAFFARGAESLGTRIGGALGETIASQGGKIATTIAADQLVDTIVESPQTIINGINENKSFDQITKDLLTDQVVNLGINLVAGGVFEFNKFRKEYLNNVENIDQVVTDTISQTDSVIKDTVKDFNTTYKSIFNKSNDFIPKEYKETFKDLTEQLDDVYKSFETTKNFLESSIKVNPLLSQMTYSQVSEALETNFDDAFKAYQTAVDEVETVVKAVADISNARQNLPSFKEMPSGSNVDNIAINATENIKNADDYSDVKVSSKSYADALTDNAKGMMQTDAELSKIMKDIEGLKATSDQAAEFGPLVKSLTGTEYVKNQMKNVKSLFNRMIETVTDPKTLDMMKKQQDDVINQMLKNIDENVYIGYKSDSDFSLIGKFTTNRNYAGASEEVMAKLSKPFEVGSSPETALGLRYPDLFAELSDAKGISILNGLSENNDFVKNARQRFYDQAVKKLESEGYDGIVSSQKGFMTPFDESTVFTNRKVKAVSDSEYKPPMANEFQLPKKEQVELDVDERKIKVDVSNNPQIDVITPYTKDEVLNNSNNAIMQNEKLYDRLESRYSKLAKGTEAKGIEAESSFSNTIRSKTPIGEGDEDYLNTIKNLSFDYNRKSNDQQIKDAMRLIEEYPDELMQNLRTAEMFTEVEMASVPMIVQALQSMDNTDYDLIYEIIENTRRVNTSAGRTIQLNKLWQVMTPEGATNYIIKKIDSQNAKVFTNSSSFKKIGLLEGDVKQGGFVRNIRDSINERARLQLKVDKGIELTEQQLKRFESAQTRIDEGIKKYIDNINSVKVFSKPIELTEANEAIIGNLINDLANFKFNDEMQDKYIIDTFRKLAKENDTTLGDNLDLLDTKVLQRQVDVFAEEPAQTLDRINASGVFNNNLPLTDENLSDLKALRTKIINTKTKEKKAKVAIDGFRSLAQKNNLQYVNPLDEIVIGREQLENINNIMTSVSTLRNADMDTPNYDEHLKVLKDYLTDGLTHEKLDNLNIAQRARVYTNGLTYNDVDKMTESRLIELSVRKLFAAETTAKVSSTFGEKAATVFYTSMLNNMKTVSGNLLNNPLSAALQDNPATRLITVGADKFISKFTDQTTQNMNLLRLPKNVTEAANMIKKEKRTNTLQDIRLGLMSRGQDKFTGIESDLTTFRAENFLKPDARLQMGVKNVTNEFMQTFGERVSQLGLVLPDETFKAKSIAKDVVDGLVRDELLTVDQLKGMSAIQIKEEIENAPSYIYEQAKEYAEFKAFQNDSYVNTIFQQIQNLGNTIGIGKSGKKLGGVIPIKQFGLGNMIIPFTRVAGNVIERGLEATPAGFMKIAYMAAQGSKQNMSKEWQANLARLIGRVTTLNGIVAMGAYMRNQGIITTDDGSLPYSLQAQARAEGKSGTQLNLSQLGRVVNFMEDGQEVGNNIQNNDILLSLDRLDILTAPLKVGAQLSEVFENNGINDFTSAVSGIGEAGFNSIAEVADIPMMSTINAIFYESQKEDGMPLPIVTIPLTRGLASFVPDTVKSIGKVTDETARRVDKNTLTGKLGLDSVQRNIPGLREGLQPNIAASGELVPQGEQNQMTNFANNFFLPLRISTAKVNETTATIEDLYVATEKSGFLPSTKIETEIKFQNKNYALTQDQQTLYQQMRNQNLHKAYDAIFTNLGNLDNYDDKQLTYIAEELSKAKSLVYKNTREDFVNRYVDDLTPIN